MSEPQPSESQCCPCHREESARLLYSIEAAAEQLSIGRSTLEELIRDGVVETVRIRRRRLVPDAALDDYIERLRKTA
jgi:excisionase family DNA binding protein